jgi:preprotein translocase subunit YajC
VSSAVTPTRSSFEVAVTPIDFLPIVGIFAVMYFVMIRPQMREKAEHDKLVASLARGDRVVTASGVHGTIANVSDDTILLEVAERTKITIDKSTIARRTPPAAEDKPPKKGPAGGTGGAPPSGNE